MCGIAGFWGPNEVAAGDLKQSLQGMTAAITHRGPNSAGYWVDESVGLALGHRRLSILELSPAGHQPMTSSCGRYVISFNGEIYNHLELRRELSVRGETPVWRGHSDTETLLACFSAWGVKQTLHATVGMFAFALWDLHDRILTLARDRLGEKPLYYGWQGGTLLFGSELKALKAHPAFHAEVDRDALTLLLRHNCIPAPYSIYQGIRKLMPGHYLSIPLISGRMERSVPPQSWWCFNDVISKRLAEPFIGSDADAIDALEARLSESVRFQMQADVPVGAFLSGGIDSSTIAAMMQMHSNRPVRTFTIGTHATDNEAEHAKAIARHLGTEHIELYVTPEDALAVVPKLPTIYCEPFGDSSQIPTFLISQLAAGHVKVALSGDAGDELFGGYNRYLDAHRLWHRMNRLPPQVRRATAAGLCALSPTTWDMLYSAVSPILPNRLRLTAPGDKAHKLAEVLALEDGQAFYQRLTSHWNNPVEVVIGAKEPQTLLTNPSAWPDNDGFEHWMMAMDAQTYMPEDILVKVDRAAMANSLETRIPLLDHRVVELAWRLPRNQKIRKGQGKWLLRQVLYRYVPKELIERPKMGFGIPLDSWLRGPLKEWAETLLAEHRLKREGFFNPGPIRQKWMEHLSGQSNWQYHLWDVLMFQAWLESNP
ncbi:MAG TPA: asparagine synthase (glutamine-hydrolyzing) [Desulfobacterales bacterium]|nr:asparagine synthase (glutamine-hydrolyzing) [Desulfobacterales bacterium]